MADDLGKQIEELFTNAKANIESRMKVENVQANSSMEVRVFGGDSNYGVAIKAFDTGAILQSRDGIIIYKEKVGSAELAVGLGDKFSSYLKEKGHCCPVDLTHLSDETKQKLGIPIITKS